MESQEPKIPSFSDPEMVRALAHPARLAVLDHLGDIDEATATECATVAGLSPSAMSYHLRTLAKVGLIEEADGRGDGRERVWRRKLRGFSVGVDYDAPPSLKLTGRALVEAFQARSDAKLQRWLDVAGDEPREWYEQMQFDQSSLMVTPEELTEIKEKLAELLGPYSLQEREGHEPEGARRVGVHTRIFPEV